MRAEVRNALDGCNRLADAVDCPEKFAFAFILDKTNDTNAVMLGEYTDIVIHPDATAVHLQDRRIRRQHQNIHLDWYELCLIRAFGRRPART